MGIRQEDNTRIRHMLIDCEQAATQGDNEAAHVMEDDLRHEVLKLIHERTSDKDIADLAKMALSTSMIKFSRWYA